MKRENLVPVTLGMLLVAGCGTTGAAPNDSEADRGGKPVDVSVLRTSEYNYQVFSSLGEMAASEPVVVTGVVRGFSAGHTVLTESFEPYHGVQEPHAVMRVDVDEVFKGAKYVHEGAVYVSLSRGAEAITESGEPDRPPGVPSLIRTVDEFGAAIPADTRVALLVRPKDTEEYRGEKFLNVHDGYPSGATLLSAHPQGLIFENGLTGSLVGGYVDLPTNLPGWLDLTTFDDIPKELRAQFGTS